MTCHMTWIDLTPRNIDDSTFEKKEIQEDEVRRIEDGGVREKTGSNSRNHGFKYREDDGIESG